MGQAYKLTYTTLDKGIKSVDFEDDGKPDGDLARYEVVVRELTAATRGGGMATFEGDVIPADSPIKISKVTEVKLPEKPKTANDKKADPKAPATASVPSST